MKAVFTHPFSMRSITLSFNMHDSTPVAARTYRLLFFGVLNRGEHFMPLHIFITSPFTCKQASTYSLHKRREFTQAFVKSRGH